MNPVTAVNFILAGVSLWLLQGEQADARHAVAQLFGGIITVVGLLALTAILLNQQGVDQLLFHDKLGIGSVTPNRMSPTTAVDFILIGLALLVANVERPSGSRPGQTLAIITAWIALLALIGYLYGTTALYQIKSFIPMAVHTALTFSVLSLGFLALRPDRGVMARVTGDSAGGVMIRRMLVAIIGIPVVLGWLTLRGQSAEIYDPGFGFSLFVVLIMIVFSLMTWTNAVSLDQQESERNRAAEQLRQAHNELESRVQERTADLANVLVQVGESITVLGSSAGGIVDSTTQLSSGATNTATAITETTTTVAEVRQTAELSSQKARLVADSAQRAAQIAQSGKRATEDTSTDMQRIQTQMDSIGDTMSRLTEQTQLIGAIIATVDDLAQRSNLLAVNASIEAAKAGEQGKGFAVVAQEVRNLAEQSKQATTQVRNILNDIQRATGAAVMATEQGSKAVEAGVQQASQAGESILTLADSMAAAAQAATQIAASNQQQLVGMDQVVGAMENVKQASLQNVDSAKQLETAARNLNELGQRLKQLVEQYQV
ncbi:MAG: methyl-accepting chemotaxis protein [Armatimonadota bacterium]|nr:methyl-accepting chemotaxis protein [Armatimonadota bacterium]